MYPWFESPLQDIRKRISTKTLHHGLLFVADKGVGEALMLERVAQLLLCNDSSACGKCKHCLLMAAGSHPDLKIVHSDKPSIGVDLIRSVSEFVNKTAQLGGNKVVIINQVHLMTESASNSLLKTLEEPTKNTYLLLDSHESDSLLATIKSRCEKIRLSLPNSKQALEWLRSQSQEAVTEEGLRAYLYSPIDYLQALSDKALTFSDLQEDLQNCKAGKAQVLTLSDKWEKQAQQAIDWIYQHTSLQYSKMLDDESIVNATQIDHILNECIVIKQKVSQAGINKKLLLQRIFQSCQ